MRNFLVKRSEKNEAFDVGLLFVGIRTKWTVIVNFSDNMQVLYFEKKDCKVLELKVDE